ncbi:hypothetical protein Pmani_037287 [Petrolisthes manimaculis]|uniref:D-dopachrome decarboxylase n=1 Tax=Petrolisthes manimaculis TaxID=1843537 RepID=A0AAE1NI00_9EUCA|nr:hypothetical protein Pmani_037287 [Petrolisthes manimaculis]
MPIVLFKTNLPNDKISHEFHKQLSAKLAEVLGKKEERVSVTVECGARLCRGGNFDPICELHIISLYLNTSTQTQAATTALTPFITQHTHIPANRVVLSFQAPEPFMVAIDGKVVQR